MVYPATHMPSGECRAAKLVKIRQWDQYLLERGAMMRLSENSHRNILQCLKDWVAPDYRTAVQLFPLGQFTLFELLRKKGVRYPRQAFQFCQDVALGTSHLHLLSILHRDIKTDNVICFIEPSLTNADAYYTVAKIGDFSLAKLVRGDQEEQEAGMAACISRSVHCSLIHVSMCRLLHIG